ncbi:hypothetical protein TNCV_4979141 [Trichonephila clavipes]|nr:hypothetical protein TNCV_4979141 [Trichonephila clavipes]
MGVRLWRKSTIKLRSLGRLDPRRSFTYTRILSEYVIGEGGGKHNRPFEHIKTVSLSALLGWGRSPLTPRTTLGVPARRDPDKLDLARFSVWQSNWDQQTENKLHSVMPVLAPIVPSSSNRREQVIRTRLRLDTSA